MIQQYPLYTKADHDVWRILFERQTTNLADKACTEYLECLGLLEPVLNARAIPRFDELDSFLSQETGWVIEVVPGHIPVHEFFDLLSRRRFPSSTWLRTMDQLDYLEEPDMFHDIYGHIPLLVEARYADFMQRIGQLGTDWSHDEEVVRALRSLYWFTIEFGMLSHLGQRKIYGAGILSSYGESRRVVMASTECLAFDIDRILGTDFRTDTMQECYYGAPTYDAFLASIDDVESILSHRLKRTRSTR